MGGAESIDKQWRKFGYDWFPEETITQKNFMNLPDVEVDIFITHTCPNELILDLQKKYREKGHEPSNDALSELWKIYKPKLWFFGHWHQFMNVKMMGTQCFCLSAPGFGDRWWMWLPERK
jgi:Icc-related predicted phosphoesterase